VVNDIAKASEYLKKGHDLSYQIGNTQMQTITIDLANRLSGKDTSTPSFLKIYCDNLYNIANSLKCFENGIPTSEHKLPFYKYREFETERLNLVYISENDAHDIFEYASRDLPTRYVMWKRHKNIGDSIAFINFSRQEELKGNHFFWGIRLKNNAKIIGTLDLNYNKKFGDIEFGIILSDDYWKNGYAVEALAQLINYCKSDLYLKRVVGICFTANVASAKMMMNNGFIFSEKIPNYHEKSKIIDKSGKKYIKILED
jgi:ribosomal-protein-alanine N-acetyltransferase